MSFKPNFIILTFLPIFIFGFLQIRPTGAQFPRLCAENATKPNATCCPVPPGFTLPCGGPGHGMCLPFDHAHEFFSPPLPTHLKDDRINWPVAFFKYGCRCVENYGGYMCQECKWGYHGKNCSERRIQVRKNVFSLTAAEKKRFIELIDRSKYAMSEYVALHKTEMDPIKEPKWVNITVHNFIVWIHFYSARNTYFNRSSPCEFSPFHMDYSHEGSGFPTFHRLLMLTWEREIQKLAGDDTFMFPYWDWTDDGSNCTVCTNDLMGAVTEEGHIDPGSPFSRWETVCHLIRFKQCRFCDPTLGAGPIIRRPGRNLGVHKLPSEAEADMTLALPNYDVPPFDENSNMSFRSCFEGSCPRDDLYMSMHGLVHAFLNGSMSDVATSTNDPIFILHHGFLDKLLELWIRRHRPHSTQFPPHGAPLGHNLDSVMVPFYPRHFHRWYFADSRGLGYTYDDFNYGKSGKKKTLVDVDYFVDPSQIHLLPRPPRRPRPMFNRPSMNNQPSGTSSEGGTQTLMATAVAAPLIVLAFLMALVLHDRLRNNDVTITRVVGPDGKAPSYSIVSDMETSEEDELMVYCDRSKNSVLGEQGMPVEKKPLMNEIHG